MSALAIVNASVGDRRDQHILIEDGHVIEISAGRAMPPAADTIDAGGGAVLPGLWDHHVHLYSAAARRRSVDVSSVGDVREFARILSRSVQQLRSGVWLRVVGYNELTLGELTASRLHGLVPTSAPMRIQHRGGHQWVLNPAGLALLASASTTRVPEDGVLWDDDALLRSLAGPGTAAHELSAEVQNLSRQGCVGATDMTATTDPASACALRSAAANALELRVFGAPAGGRAHAAALGRLDGVKLVISDREPPDPESLRQQIAACRPLPVAMHAVTAQSLALAAWAVGEEGRGGDSIEHGFLAPDGLIGQLALRGLSLGAHPGFIWSQGDRLLQDLDGEDLSEYQNLRSWHRAGVRLLGGTDLPFATADLWRAMQSAVDRRTSAGRELNKEQALTPEEAFAMFTQEGLQGSAERPKVNPGDVANLCIVDVPWHQARRNLAAVNVRATVRSGVIRWRAPGWR